MAPPSALAPEPQNLIPAKMTASSSSEIGTTHPKEDAKSIDVVLRQFRCLIADLCQQFNGGHPG